jgi:fatty-acyl-CoA synthase
VVLIVPECAATLSWRTSRPWRACPSFERFCLDQLSELSAAAPFDRPLPKVGPNDPVQIQYTSGTTGFPKGAVLRHMGVVNNAALWADRVGIPDGSVMLSPMPLFHTGGCVISYRRARRLTEYSPAFDPA